MKLLKQPTPNCLLYSAAMVFDATPEDMIRAIGHDGLEVWWPELPYPRCLRGFHIEEIQDYAWNHNYLMFPIHPMPCSSPYDDGGMAKPVYNAVRCDERTKSYLWHHDAIIITDTHACAWNAWEEKVYDPNGMLKNITDYQIVELWPVVNRI